MPSLLSRTNEKHRSPERVPEVVRRAIDLLGGIQSNPARDPSFLLNYSTSGLDD
jgi:hypothetical protein